MAGFTLTECENNIKQLIEDMKASRIKRYKMQTQSNQQEVERSSISDLQKELKMWIHAYKNVGGGNEYDVFLESEGASVIFANLKPHDY